MSRLQKKCVIASAGAHLLLILILLIGPAFLSSNRPAEDVPLIDFVPVKTVDAAMSGGGNPNGGPPPLASQPTPPAPPAQPARQPEPQKDDAPDPEKAVARPERRHEIQVSKKLVRTPTEEIARARAAAERRAAQIAEARRRREAIGQVVAGIQSGLSGSTSVELKGPGGGGLPYANWKQAVKSVYDRAWLLPNGIKADPVTTTVEVTIARDGKVVAARITARSGNAEVDDSVQAALDRVRYAAPLPDDAREDERTITIYFDVQAKLLG
jgi:TonB family protein